jgi:hypothetical protein
MSDRINQSGRCARLSVCLGLLPSNSFTFPDQGWIGGTRRIDGHFVEIDRGVAGAISDDCAPRSLDGNLPAAYKASLFVSNLQLLPPRHLADESLSTKGISGLTHPCSTHTHHAPSLRLRWPVHGEINGDVS